MQAIPNINSFAILTDSKSNDFAIVVYSKDTFPKGVLANVMKKATPDLFKGKPTHHGPFTPTIKDGLFRKGLTNLGGDGSLFIADIDKVVDTVAIHGGRISKEDLNEINETTKAFLKGKSDSL